MPVWRVAIISRSPRPYLSASSAFVCPISVLCIAIDVVYCDQSRSRRALPPPRVASNLSANSLSYSSHVSSWRSFSRSICSCSSAFSRARLSRSSCFTSVHSSEDRILSSSSIDALFSSSCCSSDSNSVVASWYADFASLMRSICSSTDVVRASTTCTTALIAVGISAIQVIGLAAMSLILAATWASVNRVARCFWALLAMVAVVFATTIFVVASPAKASSIDAATLWRIIKTPCWSIEFFCRTAAMLLR